MSSMAVAKYDLIVKPKISHFMGFAKPVKHIRGLDDLFHIVRIKDAMPFIISTPLDTKIPDLLSPTNHGLRSTVK